MKRKPLIILVVLSIFLNCFTVFAAESTFTATSDILSVTYDEDRTELTLAAAIEKAVSNSSALKNANSQLSISEKERDDLWENYVYNGSDGFSELLSIIKYDLTQSNSSLSYEQKKDSVKDSMKSAYVSLINSENELLLKEASLKLASSELGIIRLKANLGMITEQELANSELSYAADKASYEDKKASLEEAYESFNTLIGAQKGTRFILTFGPVYEDLNLGVSIDSYITTSVSGSSNIKQKQNSLKSAEEEFRLFYASNSSYDSLKNNVNSASLEVKDAKDTLSANIRSCYNSIISLEASYTNNLKQLEILKNELAIAEKKYELDMITELELEEVKYNLASMESTIISQIYEHMILSDRIENVDLL